MARKKAKHKAGDSDIDLSKSPEDFEIRDGMMCFGGGCVKIGQNPEDDTEFLVELDTEHCPEKVLDGMAETITATLLKGSKTVVRIKGTEDGAKEADKLDRERFEKWKKENPSDD